MIEDVLRLNMSAASACSDKNSTEFEGKRTVRKRRIFRIREERRSRVELLPVVLSQPDNVTSAVAHRFLDEVGTHWSRSRFLASSDSEDKTDKASN